MSRDSVTITMALKANFFLKLTFQRGRNRFEPEELHRGLNVLVAQQIFA